MGGAAEGRTGINFPGEREGERRNGMLLAPPIGSNCISTPGEREVLQRWAMCERRKEDEGDRREEEEEGTIDSQSQ